MLHLYYTKLTTNKQKQEFIRQVQEKCRVNYPTVRTWIADPSASMHRNPKPLYRKMISEIAGLPEEELFPNLEEVSSL